jgi:hypothetical protein
MKKTLLVFVPFAVAITLLCGLVLVTVQQNYRMSANDPQIQYAQDVALNFKDEKSAANMVPQDKTDLASSLATFGVVYNKDGGLLASSGVLDNQTPSLPKGVLDKAKKQGTYAFTWAPKKDVRVAAVVTKADAGYVLIGRSLKEVEKRENSLYLMALAGWLITLLATFASIWGIDYLANKKPSKKTSKKI